MSKLLPASIRWHTFSVCLLVFQSDLQARCPQFSDVFPSFSNRVCREHLYVEIVQFFKVSSLLPGVEGVSGVEGLDPGSGTAVVAKMRDSSLLFGLAIACVYWASYCYTTYLFSDCTPRVHPMLVQQ